MKKIIELDKQVFQKRYGYIMIDEKYYESEERGNKYILKEVKKSKVLEDLKLTKEIITKIKDNLDAEKVLTESIMKLKTKDIKKLHSMLFQDKKTYTVKTREHNCVDMKVGNFILPIVE